MERKDELERAKQKEFFSPLLPEIDMNALIDEPTQARVKKLAQPVIDIPDVEAPPAGTAPAPQGAPAPVAPAAPGQGLPTPPAPSLDAGLGAPAPPLGGPAPEPFGDKDKEKMDKALEKIKDQIKDIKNELNIDLIKEELMSTFKEYYRGLEEELKSLKEKQIPERKYFDTEGAYRDTLYGMATRLLDEFLPDLFETVPDYSFIATQVSRTFDDGTVADALITLIVTVPRNGMRYEFKVEVPVLNGLMQYPLYIQRGQKIIPLTKSEIMRELNSMSYRKLDIERPYDKANIFNNIGENIHRRPDDQKWIEVAPNSYKPVGLPPMNKYPVQRGRE